METFLSHSPYETKAFASRLAGTLPRGSIIAFYGDLGAGKTAFTAGFVEGLGIDCPVYSPTFALVNRYNGNGKTVYHYDMYRVDTWDDLYSTGFFDCIDTDAYLCIEWSENIDGALPDDAICIEIERVDDSARKISVYKKGERQ